MLVRHILQRWLILRSIAVRQSTYDSYDSVIRLHINPSIGDDDVEDTDLPLKIVGLIRDLMAVHPRTAELVHVILAAAMRDQRINPMAGIPKPHHKAKIIKAWDDDQIAQYMDAIEESPHRLGLLLGLLTGMRRGEICGAEWRDIDWSRGCIHVARQMRRTSRGLEITEPKTDAGRRDIPLVTYMLDALAVGQALAGTEERICPITPSGLYHAHVRICKAAGLPHCGLHGLRHTMATNIVRHGGSISGLQKILGHAHYGVTADVYAPADYIMSVTAMEHLTLNQGVQGSSP